MTIVAGVDVSASAAHLAVLDADGRLVAAGVYPTDDVESLVSDLADCEVVAIDSPDRWSGGPLPEHAWASQKFRSARCAELELGRRYGFWVPWVTPLPPRTVDDKARYGWMSAGIALFHRLGVDRAIEVYPNSIYRRLAGSTLSKKSTAAGAKERIELLRAWITPPRHIEMWSHDALDSLAAALVALQRLHGLAERVSCDHDGSAMWLPRTPSGSLTSSATAPPR
ncbi:MAG TPA: DUF429 domain-containing protein [Candidatus Tectomicrobia bacterium]|nr:DUF429 domain-containing protein [Candidatus Tectomicrobia bacterium]